MVAGSGSEVIEIACLQHDFYVLVAGACVSAVQRSGLGSCGRLCVVSFVSSRGLGSRMSWLV